MPGFECEYCHDVHRAAWLAATCCDPISNDLEDDAVRSVN